MYKINKIEQQTTENFATTDDAITLAVKRIYLADVEAIRLLSNFAIILSQGGLTVPGNLTIAGATTIQGDATVTGVLTTGNTKVGGTLETTGATTLKNTLNVTGNTTLTGTLQIGTWTIRSNAEGLQFFNGSDWATNSACKKMVIKDNSGLWTRSSDFSDGNVPIYVTAVSGGNAIALGNGYIYNNGGGLGLYNSDGNNWFQVDKNTGTLTVNGNEVS